MQKSGNTSDNTPAKRRNFTFVLHDPTQWERAIDYAENCPMYAYVKHDRDNDTTPHYHFYIEFLNARSFRSVSDDLGIPSHMLEKPRTPEGLLFYLTHQDKKSQAAGKAVYKLSEIVTNMPETKFQAPLDKSAFWDKVFDLVDHYYKGEVSYTQLQRQLKLSLVDTMTPVGIVNLAFKIRSYAVPTSDDFRHVPNVETPFGPALGTSDLTNVPSSTCQNKPKQRSIFPFYPT